MVMTRVPLQVDKKEHNLEILVFTIFTFSNSLNAISTVLSCFEQFLTA
jgi:hypothetical protein